LLPAASTIDLISPVQIFPQEPYTSGVPVISVNGNAASEYGGSFSLNPGSNTPAGGAAAAGINIKSTPYGGPAPAGGTGAAGVSVEIGTNGNNGATGSTGPFVENHLYIAGTFGLSEVNDPVYNPVQPFVTSKAETVEAPITPVNGAIGKVTNVLTIPIVSGATGAVSCPSSYNLFSMSLDFSFAVVTTGAGPDSYKLYLASGATAGYAAASNITFLRFGGTGSYVVEFKDVPLELFASAGNVSTLYLNIQNETVVEGGDVTDFTYDYAVRCDRATAIVIPA